MPDKIMNGWTSRRYTPCIREVRIRFFRLIAESRSEAEARARRHAQDPEQSALGADRHNSFHRTATGNIHADGSRDRRDHGET